MSLCPSHFFWCKTIFLLVHVHVSCTFFVLNGKSAQRTPGKPPLFDELHHQAVEQR